MHRFFFTIILILSLMQVKAQQKISYGNNAAAGKYYAVRGINLYCEVYGKGKPLLLLHGNGGNISAFEKSIPWLAKRYKVIAVDSRAHGKSKDTGDSLSFEMMADDFAVLLTAMKLDSAYVLGWSDGGITAIIMAMRHPEKVIKFASTGANLWPDSTALLPAVWKDGEQYYETNKNKVWTSEKEKNDWKIFMLDWLQPNIKLSALQAIKCPALIIAGDHDLIVPAHTLAIAQHIPKAFLWIVPNSSHGTLIEHTEEFNKKVDAFFREHW